MRTTGHDRVTDGQAVLAGERRPGDKPASIHHRRARRAPTKRCSRRPHRTCRRGSLHNSSTDEITWRLTSQPAPSGEYRCAHTTYSLLAMSRVSEPGRTETVRSSTLRVSQSRPPHEARTTHRLDAGKRPETSAPPADCSLRDVVLGGLTRRGDRSGAWFARIVLRAPAYSRSARHGVGARRGVKAPCTRVATIAASCWPCPCPSCRPCPAAGREAVSPEGQGGPQAAARPAAREARHLRE